MTLSTQHSLVSVIIPAYNAERYLSEAIESILAQSYCPFEIIVVDDGSTDSSAAIVHRYASDVRYIFQQNQGQAVAFNTGINAATGDFLAFLDADDLWIAEKLSLQVLLFEKQPDLEAVFGHLHQFYSPDVVQEQLKNVKYAHEIMPGYSTTTLLLKTSAFQRIGYFKPEQRIGAFIEWFCRAQEQNINITMMPDVLCKRRIHDANMGIRERASALTEYPNILKAALDRRRMQQPK